MIAKKEGFEGQRACILPQAMRNFSMKHRFCRLLHVTDIGYYPRASYHNRERKKGCGQYVLIYCVKGRGWYNWDNHFTGGQARFYYDYLSGIRNGPVNTPPSSHRLQVFDGIMDHLELMYDEDNMVYANSQLHGFLSGFRETQVRGKNFDNQRIQ